jgi:hypothetical protein
MLLREEPARCENEAPDAALIGNENRAGAALGAELPYWDNRVGSEQRSAYIWISM